MTAPKQSSALGLDALGDLAGLLELSSAGTGEPLELALDLIDEDPNQPRTRDNPGFSVESLKELAATIGARGVKTPISVRVNPHLPGRYLINHGARRVRASRMAGKTTVPAYVDNDYNEADQVIENLQRNDLTPREIADWIGREIARGYKKGDIAKALGKSPSFVSQHVTLLDLPDPIAEVFNSGRTRDVTLVNELVTVYKQRSTEVADWLADPEQEITRGSVKLLREYVDEKMQQERERHSADVPAPGSYEGEADEVPSAADAEPHDPGRLRPDDAPDLNPDPDPDPDPAEPVRSAPTHRAEDRDGAAPIREPRPKLRNPETICNVIVQVVYGERPARLVLDRRAPAPGYAWVRYDDGSDGEADLAGVRIVALVEA